MKSIEIITQGIAFSMAADRRRRIRDRVLCAIEDAGRAMSPGEIAATTGLGIAAVTIAATDLRTYFTTTYRGKLVALIDLHPHLKPQAQHARH